MRKRFGKSRARKGTSRRRGRGRARRSVNKRLPRSAGKVGYRL